jgi:hypothetical protein
MASTSMKQKENDIKSYNYTELEHKEQTCLERCIYYI